MNTVVKANKLLNSDKYINWIENFTNEHNKFYCDSWINTTEESRENIQNIVLFYEIIKNYAIENYINPVETKCGNYYSIKHNNIGYNIGIMIGPETIYYCSRSNQENEKFINFKDIQNDTKTNTAILINNKMNEISQLINNMIDSNINPDIILEATEKTLKKVLKR